MEKLRDNLSLWNKLDDFDHYLIINKSAGKCQQIGKKEINAYLKWKNKEGVKQKNRFKKLWDNIENTLFYGGIPTTKIKSAAYSINPEFLGLRFVRPTKKQDKQIRKRFKETKEMKKVKSIMFPLACGTKFK